MFSICGPLFFWPHFFPFGPALPTSFQGPVVFLFLVLSHFPSMSLKELSCFLNQAVCATRPIHHGVMNSCHKTCLATSSFFYVIFCLSHSCSQSELAQMWYRLLKEIACLVNSGPSDSRTLVFEYHLLDHSENDWRDT